MQNRSLRSAPVCFAFSIPILSDHCVKFLLWHDALAIEECAAGTVVREQRQAMRARETKRAEAYFDSMLSTVSERNEADTALSRAAPEEA